MLESCIGQNMDFRGFHGRNAESQTVAERPEEGEERTHDTSDSDSDGSSDGDDGDGNDDKNDDDDDDDGDVVVVDDADLTGGLGAKVVGRPMQNRRRD